MSEARPSTHPTTTRPAIGYQPALDGVRAIAVFAVLLFHARVPGATGGYLGVSIFFTLSGFLITSLLVSERAATGRVALVAFYARRARRLLPASVLCVVLVVALSAITDVFAGVTELRRQAVGSLLQVANWVFLAGEGSYQDLFQESTGALSPLEHYWSLAIEEQFYWIWPLAFGGLVTVARSRRGQIWVLAVATVVAGLAAPAIAAVWGGDAAYWATPARAAEILVGALLAVVLAGRSVAPAWASLAPAALVVLVVAMVTFPAAGGPAYSGALPLVGVVSAALLLGLQAPGPLRTALGVAPLVWLGRISYGVYLYHWPIYVIVDDRRTGLDPVPLFAVRVALTLLAAQLSFTLFEQPIRRGGRRTPVAEAASTAGHGGRRTLVGAIGATAVVVTAIVVVVPGSTSDYWSVSAADAAAAAIGESAEPLAPLVSAATTGAPSTPLVTTRPATTRPVTTRPAVPTTPATTGTTTPATTTATTSATTTTLSPVPVLERPVRIVVAGDSTAEAAGVGLVGWAVDHPELAQVELVAAPGCGFVRGGAVFVEDWRPVPERCDDWLDVDLPAEVARLRPDVVMLKTTSWDVLDHRWHEGERYGPQDPPFGERIEHDLAAVTQRLLDEGAGAVVWVRQPVPNPLWMNLGQTQQEPARHAVLYDTMDRLASGWSGRVEVVDLAGWLAEKGHDTDVEMRPDGVHWTPDASRVIAGDYLGEQLVRAALGLPRP